MRAITLAGNVSVLAFGTLACIAGSAVTASLTDSPVTFRSGAWSVHRTRDAMTDATVCTGIYKDQFNIQLGDDALTIAVADGVKSIRLRFDNEDVQPFRDVSGVERRSGIATISAHDFQELLGSKRLRYEILTETGNSVSGDLNLDGVFLVHDNVRAGCAGNPLPASSISAVSAACSKSVRDRMAQKGLSVQDIADVCDKQP